AVHGFGQQPARGPDLAEMAPLGRGDAQAFAVAIGVGELLAVAEYAQAVAVRADRRCEGTGVVAGHEGLPEGASILPDRAWEGATGGPVRARARHDALHCGQGSRSGLPGSGSALGP